MNPLVRTLYAGAGLAARAAAAIAPAGDGKLRRTLAARRGIRARYAAWGAHERDPARPLLWMHAPSVGEGLQARPVLQLARRAHPELQLAYTFFSPSAERFAAGLDVDFRDFLPFDTSGDARAALDALRPSALVFSKLDVWPVLADAAGRRGVPTGLVSATLASGSTRRSGVAAAVLRDAYAGLDAVGAISDEDAERLVALGVRRGRIVVTGDTRYDQVWQRAHAVDPEGPLLSSLASQRFTVVAGSTWPADEAVLLEAWLALRRHTRDVRLVIAPHEPTPAHLAPVERWAMEHRVPLLRLSQAAETPRAGSVEVLLVDRVGVLGELYALADAAFVGGGFHAAGLHSVLEPAAFGVPVLFGPRHANSRDAELLLDARGAATAATARTMAEQLNRWVSSPTLRVRDGAAARAVVEHGLGAAERAWALVAGLLDGTR